MSADTGGLGRLCKRNAAGNVVNGSESKAFRLADWDNTAAPRVVMNDPGSATPDDLHTYYNVAVRGRFGEVLEFQNNMDAGDIADTGDGDTLFVVKVYMKQPDGTTLETYRNLRLADRVTPDGANTTRSHPGGLADDPTWVAAAWSPYLRFAPGPNDTWVLEGHQRTDVHNDT